jgi:hypothetical protein
VTASLSLLYSVEAAEALQAPIRVLVGAPRLIKAFVSSYKPVVNLVIPPFHDTSHICPNFIINVPISVRT